MKESHFIQSPAKTGPNSTLLERIQSHCHTDHFDEVSVSMAYVSVSGVRGMLSSFAGEQPKTSKWVVGLDDFTSQPGAIENLLQLPFASVKVASLGEHSLRFHPKVIYLTSSDDPTNALMIVGSANLTRRGLTQNVEAMVFLKTESAEDKVTLDRVWDEHWDMGRVPSGDELENYSRAYAKLRARSTRLNPPIKATVKVKKSHARLVLDNDEAEIDPANAGICWIECGSVTAMGRELELKAEQGLFFGLSQQGGPTRQLNFRVSNGNTIPLKMKYQGNHMWRLQMTNEVPEVAVGLRPTVDGRLQRSPYVAVFFKTDIQNTFRLRFIHVESKQFESLKSKTQLHGTMGQTTARSYGWI